MSGAAQCAGRKIGLQCGFSFVTRLFGLVITEPASPLQAERGDEPRKIQYRASGSPHSNYVRLRLGDGRQFRKERIDKTDTMATLLKDPFIVKSLFRTVLHDLLYSGPGDRTLEHKPLQSAALAAE